MAGHIEYGLTQVHNIAHCNLKVLYLVLKAFLYPGNYPVAAREEYSTIKTGYRGFIMDL
jgi:hypothetical protein